MLSTTHQNLGFDDELFDIYPAVHLNDLEDRDNIED
jgi:hypothetical protein